MDSVYQGCIGPDVELVQLALQRSGALLAPPDGVFGPRTAAGVRRFQSAWGLAPDGIVGPRTAAALRPFLVGSFRYTVRPGDTLWRIARRNGIPLSSLAEANPGIDPDRLSVGQPLTVPYPFFVVTPSVHPTYEAVSLWCEGLLARHPSALQREIMGKSVLGRDLPVLLLGGGPRRVFANAAHHANEYITVTLCMYYAEALLRGLSSGGRVGGYPAAELLARATLFIAPTVNPDGVDLCCGVFPEDSGIYRDAAAMNTKGLPFPAGWKANIRGTDLNLQYPAGWEKAKEIKFAAGYTAPGPRDYVGPAPLSAPESLAVYEYTRKKDFHRTLSFHTQGEVIYWKYGETDPEGAEALVRRLAAVSGYTPEITPPASAYAGYKDWFIKAYERPGYTVEAGKGENPLPLRDFSGLWRACAPLISETLIFG